MDVRKGEPYHERRYEEEAESRECCWRTCRNHQRLYDNKHRGTGYTPEYARKSENAAHMFKEAIRYSKKFSESKNIKYCVGDSVP